MFGLLNEYSGPQPPKMLTSALEINATLRSLLEHSVPLTLTFADRNQRFLSYLVAVDRENTSLAFDELVPEGAERLLLSGEPLRIEAYLEGVRVNWNHQQTPISAKLDGNLCYWFKFPTEVRYHQRRNAYRAATLPEQPVNMTLAGNALTTPLDGQLLDLSVTGCKARIHGLDFTLESAQLYENSSIQLLQERLEIEMEARHVKVNEALEYTEVGLKFHNLTGGAQRSIERYVYHLQREAKRSTSDDLF